ncbi:GNAT family N-acetyltransferase [Pseudoalteromonas sp. B160]|uniref:GNAT family N-acetyltransferase n=1 Tax=Pseudoalteromonas sp. B160 TaxID=630414 RepID=UPI00301DFD8E
MNTQRLILRHGQPSDASFILSLLNQPSFYRYIADKGIYTKQQAEDYLQKTFIDGHQQQGFGPYIAANKQGIAMGMVGLFQREALAVPMKRLQNYYTRIKVSSATLPR